MKIGDEEVANLISTFTPSARQRFKTLLRASLSDLPSTPVLEGEALAYFQAQIKATIFFLHSLKRFPKSVIDWLLKKCSVWLSTSVSPLIFPHGDRPNAALMSSSGRQKCSARVGGGASVAPLKGIDGVPSIMSLR